MDGRTAGWRNSPVFLVFPLAAAAMMAPSHAQEPPKPCRDGLVLRGAFPDDKVCVSPQTRAQVLEDNTQAEARREPGGGAYGPNTCRQGFVWRVARPDDLVCVTPEIRAQTAADNASAAAAAQKPTPSPPPPQPAPVYRLGEWSRVARIDGVSYRYRWGFDPARPKKLDAIFEVENLRPEKWDGSVRSTDCDRGVLGASKSLSLAAKERRQAQFLTDNCGTAQEPFFKGSVARSVRFD